MALKYDDHRHRYWDEQGRIPSVTQVLSAGDIGGYEVYRFMQAKAPEKLAAYGQRGRAVHHMTQLFDDGLLDRATLDPLLEPWLIAYEKFHELFNPEMLSIERIVFHRRHRYAGRLDRIMLINGKRWLVDIKSGLVLEAAQYQTAAYLACLPQPWLYDRMLLQLRPDATIHIETPEKSAYFTQFSVFLHALEEVRGEIEAEDHEHAAA
jgi:hypothetical protein